MNPLLLLLVGGGLLAAAYATAGKRLAKIELTPTALTLNKTASNLQYSVFNLTLSFYNPNEQALKIEKFVGSIIYNNATLAVLDQTTAAGVSLPARGDKEIKYTVKAKNTSLPGALYNYVFGDSKTASDYAIIKGTLHAESMTIPIEEKVSLTI